MLENIVEHFEMISNKTGGLAEDEAPLAMTVALVT